MARPSAFDEAVDPYLEADERVAAGAVLDGGWLALTSRRCLVYAADEDGLRAVRRTEVTGVERVVTSADAHLARVPRLAVYGLTSVGVGIGARRVGRTFAAGLAGTGDAPAFGPVLQLLGLFRTGVAVLGRLGLAAGALLLLAAVGLVLLWYRSRRPAVAVETVDGTFLVAGTDREVSAAVDDLRDALGDRPDPGSLFERRSAADEGNV